MTGLWEFKSPAEFVPDDQLVIGGQSFFVNRVSSHGPHSYTVECKVTLSLEAGEVVRVLRFDRTPEPRYPVADDFVGCEVEF